VSRERERRELLDDRHRILERGDRVDQIKEDADRVTADPSTFERYSAT
jgi:hypothetical protein